jgi:hypothetical protein
MEVVMSQPTNTRTDFYTLVHKGLRKRLFEAVVLAGATDFADERSRSRLADDVKDLVETLRDHAKNEDTFVHPVLAEALPELAHSLEREHEEHDRALTEVERAFEAAFASDRVPADASRDPGQLAYRALARFAAFYLAHLEREEENQPAIWARVDEARLAAAMGAFRTSRTPEQNVAGWKLMAPALNPAERASLERARSSSR